MSKNKQRVQSVARLGVIVGKVQRRPRALLQSRVEREKKNKDEEHSILPSMDCYKYVLS